MKHVSARFAWHDDGWDGGICKNPRNNVYCTGHRSLLTSRIQRRKDPDIEESNANRKLSEVTHFYTPPCYWCINAQGSEPAKISDKHPFSDLERNRNTFSQVPPLELNLERNSIFTWCFKLGWSDNNYERYISPTDLTNLTRSYLSELESDNSLVFFYANYSNPLTADKNRFLLLGAGVLRDKKEPETYKISQKVLDNVRNGYQMGNFPKQAWQFQLLMDPSSILIMPYHTYLARAWSSEEMEIAWAELEEVSIPIEEKSIVPHFTYVSMHISHDKALYMLYQMKRSCFKMSQHGLVKPEVLDNMDRNLDRMLKLAWNQRGEYPGFENCLQILLRADYPPVIMERVITKIFDYIANTFGSKSQFFNDIRTLNEFKVPDDIRVPIKLIKRNADQWEFLSRFDFTQKQMAKIRRIFSREGFDTVKNNPYLLYEIYQADRKKGYEDDSWDIDDNDYDIGFYQIDMSLIPDPQFSAWETVYDSRSPQRLRALITSILSDSATEEGNTYMTRDQILEKISSYPLYYIFNNLEVEANDLFDYEKQQVFRDAFLIQDDVKNEEVRYQLLPLKIIEETIEKFINLMTPKKYSVDYQEVTRLANIDVRKPGNKLREKDRKELYNNALANGLYVLSGKAGSGKTQTLANLIQSFYKQGKKILVVTPTGKANIVVRQRIKSLDVHNDPSINVSTIHRFLYQGLWDNFMMNKQTFDEKKKIQTVLEKVLDGNWSHFKEYASLTKKWRSNIHVLIVDESSMVDETTLATLLAVINPDTLEHLIFVGDDKQLPPIGIGRPFSDTIFSVRKRELDYNTVQLNTNLRFPETSSIGVLADILASPDEPSPDEIQQCLFKNDNTLEVSYFSDPEELEKLLNQTIAKIGEIQDTGKLFDNFIKIHELTSVPKLDLVQIITPRRVGDYGSMLINRKLVMDGYADYRPGTKLISEHNFYFNAGGRRILGVANGSIGYITQTEDVYFDEFEEFIEEYSADLKQLKRLIKKEVESGEHQERRIDLAYAITVHKAQGSDFEHVVLVLSEINSFITRELLYTALTRSIKKLHLMVSEAIRDELAQHIIKIFNNSAIERRQTLLFGHKRSPFKPYITSLNNGQEILVRSKIENIIVKTLDSQGVNFEYEPLDFEKEYHIKPDFKISVNNKVYYLEHLGNISPKYSRRWQWKISTYRKIGLINDLITTSEDENTTNIESSIKKIIEDLKTGNLQITEGGPSLHHYNI